MYERNDLSAASKIQKNKCVLQMIENNCALTYQAETSSKHINLITISKICASLI